jgi:phage-related baseplate assembly protein
MAGTFTTVDLSKLPLPAVVEQLSFEAIFQAMLADLVGRYPAFSALVESDPAYKVLEVCAYREVLIRQRVNDAAKAVMLAYANDEDLDHIGSNFNVERLLVDAGDPDAIPPIEPTYEADDDFRRRIQLSFEALTTAGSEGSYVFHALGADADVLDVSVVSPTPGDVVVYVLSRTGAGEATDELLDAVEAALDAESVRPLTDNVTVESAEIIPYAVTAELTLYPGPDAEVVRQAAEDAVYAHVARIKRLGLDVSYAGIIAKLVQPGVQDVSIAAPTANIVVASNQAAACTSVTITINPVRDE